MKTNIFIPKKINVGFQNRSDTYTKKLAYVIYYDQKGVLRKEGSWNSWRDKNIEPITFENIPTSGFVLNKKVGDYAGHWGEHRQAYTRVYDPRDFEFEITIENLLYILENANSIKGKGLEGEFVYGWDGKDLILMPIDSPDYKEISQYNEIVHANNYIKAKDLILGATYKTKNNEEWIYMGRFDYWDTEYEYEYDQRGRKNYNTYKIINVNKGKYHYFAREYKYDWESKSNIHTIQLKSLGERFISTVSTECVENYADLFDKLECLTNYSPYDITKDKYVPYTFEEFCERIKKSSWHITFYDSNNKKLDLHKLEEEPDKCYYDEQYDDTTNTNYWSYNRKWRKIIKTFEEMFNEFKPVYKNEYLQNGKFYRRVN